MTEPKYCSHCGCYIPDLWDSCPACGISSSLNDIRTGKGIYVYSNFKRPTDEVINDIVRRVDKMYWWSSDKKLDYTKRVLTERGFTVDEGVVTKIRVQQAIIWRLKNY